MKETRKMNNALFKAKVALAAVKGDRTIAQLARVPKVNPIRSTIERMQLLETVANRAVPLDYD
jgi:hypothetical protein